MSRRLFACTILFSLTLVAMSVSSFAWAKKGGRSPTPEFRFDLVDLLGFPDRGYQSSADFINEPDSTSGRRLVLGLSRRYPVADGPAVFYPALWNVASDGSFSSTDPEIRS